jgi:hypothetical protein
MTMMRKIKIKLIMMKINLESPRSNSRLDSTRMKSLRIKLMRMLNKTKLRKVPLLSRSVSPMYQRTGRATWVRMRTRLSLKRILRKNNPRLSSPSTIIHSWTSS